ncbi:MAG: DUF4880 domain-containing protein [Methylococcaceae bacterium]|nr:DUF4880 domain-containing protein [Methylococcaceae bacterium]
MPLISQINLEALEWFTHLRNTPVAPKIEAAFNVWCIQNPEHRLAYQRIAKFWQSTAFKQALIRTSTA